MSFVKPEKSDFQAPPIREINREQRRGQIKISEEDLERLREESEESKKDSKLKPMD